MAVRQYIGARYVPLYMGDWDSTRNYEPLSIVTDGNGNSYTSLKDVPAGTPLNNRDYWIITASFSGAVDVLRRDLNQAQDDITDLQSGLNTTNINVSNLQNTIETDIDARLTAAESDISTNGQEIRRIKNAIPEKLQPNVLFVSDSYGRRTTAGGKDFAQLFTDLTGVQGLMAATGSTGFATSPSFTDVIAAFSGDKTKIKKIVVVGGANDLYNQYTYDEILSGMNSFMAHVSSNYAQGVEVLLYAAGVDFLRRGASPTSRAAFIEKYKKGAAASGMIYVNNSEYTLHNSTMLESDGCHPNSAGLTFLAESLAGAYKSNIADIYHKIDASITPAAGVTFDSAYAGHYWQELKNNVAALTGASGSLFKVDFNESVAPGLRTSGVSYTVNIGNGAWLSQYNNDQVSIIPAMITIRTGSTDDIVLGYCIMNYAVSGIIMFFDIPWKSTYTTASKVVSATLYGTYTPISAE